MNKKGRKKRGKVTPETIDEMKRLREKGMSYNKIAGKLELNPMTVYNHLKKEKKIGLIEEKEETVEERREEKVGLIERLKRALGRK